MKLGYIKFYDAFNLDLIFEYKNFKIYKYSCPLSLGLFTKHKKCTFQFFYIGLHFRR